MFIVMIISGLIISFLYIVLFLLLLGALESVLLASMIVLVLGLLLIGSVSYKFGKSKPNLFALFPVAFVVLPLLLLGESSGGGGDAGGGALMLTFLLLGAGLYFGKKGALKVEDG